MSQGFRRCLKGHVSSSVSQIIIWSQGSCLRDPVSGALFQGSCLRDSLKDPVSELMSQSVSKLVFQGSCFKDHVSRFLSQGSSVRESVSRTRTQGLFSRILGLGLRDPVSRALSQGLCLKDPVSEVLCQGSCLRGLISRILSQGSQAHGAHVLSMQKLPRQIHRFSVQAFWIPLRTGNACAPGAPKRLHRKCALKKRVPKRQFILQTRTIKHNVTSRFYLCLTFPGSRTSSLNRSQNAFKISLGTPLEP